MLHPHCLVGLLYIKPKLKLKIHHEHTTRRAATSLCALTKYAAHKRTTYLTVILLLGVMSAPTTYYLWVAAVVSTVEYAIATLAWIGARPTTIRSSAWRVTKQGQGEKCHFAP